ncbi:MOSC domain-containing protein [Marinomonas spartinae]|uniref:MOSC domain-containing protein n=1 Tax=Marinomonas spartinae TaxID=1792290 RepID=UPI0018F1CAEB|nr:MOSC domain-containing protein [Marinomonas spartinae]MBJ7553228.1 MOSC domain-containing protein [Marinomonas spartinae]
MGRVVSLSKDKVHQFSKKVVDSLSILEGLGVEGDAHCGKTVKHRSRVAVDPAQPNLRQVHLIHSELLDELQNKGFDVTAGTMGENILTEGIDLLSLPQNTLLKIGKDVELRVTGLRNPCAQLDNYQEGLTKAVLDRNEKGELIRKAGIMTVVVRSGVVTLQDAIEVILPPKPHLPLERV